MAERSEVARQLLHIGVGGFALLLPFLTWPQAAALAGAAVIFNLAVLPRLGRAVFRPGDLDRPERSGIVLYPLAVLGLVLCFRDRLDLVAVAWVVLSAGDGAATLVGAHVRSAALPWQPAKTVAGLVAFVFSAALAGIGMNAWFQAMAPGTAIAWPVAGPIAAALVAGLVETVPIRLDDNISVPAAAALVLWSLTGLDASTIATSWPALSARLPLAIGANVLVAVAGWRAGAVTRPGAATGFLVGLTIYAGAGASGWMLLLACFAAAVAATRAGYARKARLGIAEARGGRRGPGNAIANTGIAAWLALLIPGHAAAPLLQIAMVAALVTGASDTIASEVGKAWGRITWLVTSVRRVPPGTSGAASLEGTAAGVASASVLSLAAVALGLMPASAVGVVVIAATIASFAESVLGATLESSGVLDNDALNFINTGLGAGLAMAFSRVM